MQSIDIAPDEKECMMQLFFHGPTWDGDIVSKAGRAGLGRRGYVVRENGWTQLSEAGFAVAVRAGLGDDKERRDNKRRRESNERHEAICALIDDIGGSFVIVPGERTRRGLSVSRGNGGAVRFETTEEN